MKLQILVYMLVALLSGCATNMASVGTFGKAVQSLSDETDKVLSKYVKSCKDQQSLVQWQQKIIDSVDIYWHHQKEKVLERELVKVQQHRELVKVQQHIDKLSALKITLDKANQTFDLECPKQEKSLEVISEMSQVLSEYATALQSLAKDNFVTYNGQLKSLTDELSKATILDKKQTSAVEQLNSLLYNMATKSYRKSKLKEALSPTMGEHFSTLNDGLFSLSESYEGSLQITIALIGGFSSSLSNLMKTGTIPEPLAVSELKHQLEQSENEIKKKLIPALNKYQATLSKQCPKDKEKCKEEQKEPSNFDKAFKEAADSLDSDGKIIADGAIIDFAKSVYDTHKALRDAF